jgi:hypothetical protein
VADPVAARFVVATFMWLLVGFDTLARCCSVLGAVSPHEGEFKAQAVQGFSSPMWGFKRWMGV